MAVQSFVLANGVKWINYDASSRTATVYYKSGGVDIFYEVPWADFEAVTSSVAPSAAVAANLTAKHLVSSGHR